MTTLLATLAQVKTYLGAENTNQDALINSMLPAATDLVQRWLGRMLVGQTFTGKRMPGSGSSTLLLPETPIVSVEAVSIANQAVTLSSDGLELGYMYDEKFLYYIGGIFPRGLQNVTVSWTSGYAATQEANVPTGNSPTLTPTQGGNAAQDRGVTYTANGVALTAVDSSPAVGQYTFNSAASSYLFATADANTSVTMSYFYIPPSAQQAVCELISLKIQQRNNVGFRSKSLAGETISFDNSDMTSSMRMALNGLKRRAPV